MVRKKKPQRSCWDTALDLLARRAHTRAELRQKLRERQYDETEVDETLEKAKSLKLMEDDEAVAERYARSLAERRDATPVWTRSKLAQRGIDGDVARRAVERAFEGWDEREAAVALAGSDTNAKRVARKLERRGFSSDAIGWVVRRLRTTDASNWDDR